MVLVHVRGVTNLNSEVQLQIYNILLPITLLKSTSLSITSVIFLKLKLTPETDVQWRHQDGSGKRSRAGRKLDERERSGERVWKKLTEAVGR